MIPSARKNIAKTASLLLASVLSKCLPDMQLLERGELYHGFFCEFSCSSEVSKELFSLFEENLHRLLKKKCSFRFFEMVPISAKGYLKSQGQLCRSSQVLDGEGLITLAEFDSFVDCVSSEDPEFLLQMGVFRCLTLKKIAHKTYQLFGVVGSDKEDLKKLLALWKNFETSSHELAAECLGLWNLYDENLVWFARGLWVKRRLMDLWRKRISSFAEEVEGDVLPLAFLAKKHSYIMHWDSLEGDGSGMRGLLDSPDEFVLEVNSFLKDEDSCSKLLQTILQSFTIFGFTCRLLWCGKKKRGSIVENVLTKLGVRAEHVQSDLEGELVFCVQDAFGCEWKISSLKEERRGEFAFTAKVWVDRNLALMIEQNGGFLPSLLQQLSAGDSIEN